MTRSARRSAVLAATVATALLTAAAPAADPPKPRQPAGGGPAAKPAATPRIDKSAKPAPVDGSQPVTLVSGTLKFNPPDKWLDSPANRSANREIYFAPTRNALLSVELLPPEAAADKEVAAAMVRTLKKNRATAKQTFVMEPKIEDDKRFAVRIHEKYNDKEGVADQWHLYRVLDKRVVLVTVKTVAGGEAGEEHMKLAEQVAASAELVK